MVPFWLVLGCASLAVASTSPRVLPETLDAALSDGAWASWKDAHGRKYSSLAEEHARRAAWETHVRRAAMSNIRNPLAVFGTDQWSDLTDDEHPAYSRSFVPPNTTAWVVPPPKVSMSSSGDDIDWREKGVVTAVKSQVGGTCWSFSATGNAEGAWALAGNPLVALSEEKLIECGGGAGPYGIPVPGDKYDGHLPAEDDYPVAQQPGACRDAAPAARIMSVECLPNCEPDDDHCASVEINLLEWLKRGPMSVSIAADGLAGYQQGIITGDNCQHRELNHAVLLVGYGRENVSGQWIEYWIVKNSWDVGFGEQGYWRMQYGNNCMGLDGGGPCQAHATASKLSSLVV